MKNLLLGIAIAWLNFSPKGKEILQELSDKYLIKKKKSEETSD